MENKFLSRKFLSTIFLISLGYGLVVLNKLPVETWFIFATTNLGIYVTGNIADKTFAKPQEQIKQNPQSLG